MSKAYDKFLMAAAKKRARAVRMRDAGKTLAFIGEKLGVSPQRAKQLIEKETLLKTSVKVK
jgi:DNA-directed RNA polymerase sigma subunit (sigma70/sigma32)